MVALCLSQRSSGAGRDSPLLLMFLFAVGGKHWILNLFGYWGINYGPSSLIWPRSCWVQGEGVGSGGGKCGSL